MDTNVSDFRNILIAYIAKINPKSILVYTAIVFASVCLSELIYRAFTGTPLLATTNYLKDAADRHTNPVGASLIHPVLGWTMRPNSKFSQSTETPLTTGPLGIRMNKPGKIIVPPKNSILAVGDSFTAGSEEGDDGSWPAALERLLEKPVINGGVGGYGVDQITLRAEELVDEFAPSAVVYSYLDEDILRSAYSIYGGYKPYFEISKSSELELKGVPVTQVPPKFDRLGWFRGLAGHSKIIHDALMMSNPTWWLGRHLSYREEMSFEDSVKVACLLLDRISDTAKNKGFDPHFVVQYGGDLVLAGKRSWYAEQFISCARDKGFLVLDTFGPLQSLAESDFELFRTYYNEREAGTPGARFGHMSEIGNEFIAEKVETEFFSSELIDQCLSNKNIIHR